jgi:7-cyano-7-deazaguanine synthase in queuosine biosynthesis
MRHHSIVCRLGVQDTDSVIPRVGSHVTTISFVDGHHRPSFGLGQALDQLNELGLRPSEPAFDLALVAAVVTAADTRISRKLEAQDAWTREIALYIPVADPALWAGEAELLRHTLNFLTGDRWSVHFRARPAALPTLMAPLQKLRTANPSCVCLFSGGLDSFIGAIDLLKRGEVPLLVSHYWGGSGMASKYQKNCVELLRKQFPSVALNHLRADVGFPSATIADSQAESTQRGRSFMFFGLAVLAASAIGGTRNAYVPENGPISLNVPLDPMRLGALSTRTTHPYYMARVNQLLGDLGISVTLQNPYRLQTKGEMVASCTDLAFLRNTAKDTMSCADPRKGRFKHRSPKHCGYCMPCLIRRAALLRGLGSDNTPYEMPSLKKRPLDTNKAEGKDVRSFQLAIARLKADKTHGRFEIHKPGPLLDHPGDLAAYQTLYVSGLQEVERLLRGVRATPL